MEGVPRMPMLEIELKQNSIDFSSLDWAGMPSSEDYFDSVHQQTTDALKKHIREEYGDDPEKFNESIDKLLEVQLAAYKALPSPDFEGCTAVKKYFGQLHYMQSRFPFKGDNGLKATFSWQDAFTGYLTERDSFEFEQTAILFNIGAMHSILGAADTRFSEEGIRISCVHFQCAAGIFTYLSENFDTTLSPDISQFMLKLYINLLLAQGQECLLEKSMQDNRKSSIVSKICQQVVDYYKVCSLSLENRESNAGLGSSGHKAWKRMIHFKVQYYSAVTKFFLGNSALDQDKYGQSVSYYGGAVAHLTELGKLVKSFPKELKGKIDSALKFTADVLNGKYNSAVKDNNFVYHDKVPDPATLPEAKGASLVKPLPFEPANEALTGPDIFAKLVPMEAHLAASSYSEEKAKLLRSVVGSVEEKNAVIDQYKSSIELDPKNLINPDEELKLDVELIEKCALLHTDQTPISGLKEHMNVLNDVYSELDSVLNDILGIVEKEESEDVKLKDTAGKEAFSVQEDLEGIRGELSVYTELHGKASQMNEDLQTACRIHIQNMKVVAGGIDGVQEDLRLKNMSQLISDEDKNDVELIRKLCNKVVEMEQQRKNLLDQLRQQMDSDDVTSALVTKHGVDQEDLFESELKKYDSLIGTIKQNLAAQDNILDAVTEANARYAKIRKVVEAERERITQRSKNLILSCTIVPDVSSRCNDGKKFFGEILSKAKSLYDRVREFQEENEERRSEIYKKIEERKKPPPRPSAPKPNLKTPSTNKPGAVEAIAPKPGTILSPEMLAKMMAEDDDELLNDPEFLQFLQSQGDMQHVTSPGPATNMPPLLPGGIMGSTFHAASNPPMARQQPPALTRPGQVSPGMAPLPDNQVRHSSVPHERQIAQNFNYSGHSGGLPYQPQNNLPVSTGPALHASHAFHDHSIRQTPPRTAGRLPHEIQAPSPQAPMTSSYQPGHVSQRQPSQYRPVSTPEMNFQAPGPMPGVPTGSQGPSLHTHQQTMHNPVSMPYSEPPANYPGSSTGPMPTMSTSNSVFHHGIQSQSSTGPMPAVYQPGISSQSIGSGSNVQCAPSGLNSQYWQHPMPAPSPHSIHAPAASSSSDYRHPVQHHVSTGPPYGQNILPGPNASVPNSIYNQGISSQTTSGYVPHQHAPTATNSYRQPNSSIVPQPSNAGHSFGQQQQEYRRDIAAQSYAGPQVINPRYPTHSPVASSVGTNAQQYQDSFAATRNSQAHQQGGNQLSFVNNTTVYRQMPPQGGYVPGPQSAHDHTLAPSPQYQHHPSTGLPQIAPNVTQKHQAVQNIENSRLPTHPNQMHQAVHRFANSGLPPNQIHQSAHNIANPGLPPNASQTHQAAQNIAPSHLPPAAHSQASQYSMPSASQQPNTYSQPEGYPVSSGGNSVLRHSHPAQISVSFQQRPPQQVGPTSNPGNRPAGPTQSQPYSSTHIDQSRTAAGQSFQSQAPAASQSQMRVPQAHMRFRPNDPTLNSQQLGVASHVPGTENQPRFPAGMRQPRQEFRQPGTDRLVSQTPVVLPNVPRQRLIRPPGPNSSSQPTLGGVTNYVPGRPSVQADQCGMASQPQRYRPPQDAGHVQRFESPGRAHADAPRGHPDAQTQLEGRYTFRSQPHVGDLTSTPSNENSPKHVLKKPSAVSAENQPFAILKPTPVGDSSATGVSAAAQPNSDLAGLVLTPRRTLSSTADELLLSAPENAAIPTKESSQVMLIPTKVDEIDDKMVVRPVEGLPYMDEADLMKFKIHVSEFRSKVSNMLTKPDNVSLCELDREWKFLSEAQEKYSRQLSTAIARCSSYKNRFQDIVPFDQSRVILKAAKDDYINASVIDGISPYCPRFIATQSPLPNTVSDFWLMAYENHVNLIVMLVNSKDVPKKCPMYWPPDRTVPQQHGPLTVSFTTSKTHGDLYIERTFTLKHRSQSLAMSVTQLQYISWPEHRLPSSASDLLSFVEVVQSYHGSQRNLQWPVLVHCESGVGRTGVFCAFLAAINEIDAGTGIVDVVDVVTKMRQKRKYSVQEKAQLKFVYDVTLCHAVDVLKQRNITLTDEPKLTPLPVQASNNHAVSRPKPGAFDIFSNQSALSSIQATVEKMTIKPGQETHRPDPIFPVHIQSQGGAIDSTSTDNGYSKTMSFDSRPAEHVSTSGRHFDEMSDLVQDTVAIGPDQCQTGQSAAELSPPKPPDVVESCNNNSPAKPAPVTSQSPSASASPASSLIASLTPESFCLDLEDAGAKKNKISKADFYKPAEGLSARKDDSDPFSGLDPLWGLRK